MYRKKAARAVAIAQNLFKKAKQMGEVRASASSPNPFHPAESKLKEDVGRSMPLHAEGSS